MIKKICFFTTSFAMHKQVRMSHAEGYLPEKVEIFLLTPPEQNMYKLKRAKIIEISGKKIGFTLKLREFCKKNQIDLLVNLGTSNESFGMIFATFGLKTKYLIVDIGNMWGGLEVERIKYKKFMILLKIFLLTIPFIFSKKIIQLSPDIQNKTKRYFFFIKDKIKQSDLMIDGDLFYPRNKLLVRKSLKLPDNKEIILFVGRVSYLKGSDILFDLIERNPNRFFIIIGEIIDSVFKDKKFPNLLLRDVVKSKELAYYYNAADLFIFPSRVESYGLVHRESMLCGTPVLVSDIPALRVTKHAIKSKLSVEEMQRQIDNFFLAPKRERKKLGVVSREYIIKKNSYENLKNSLRDLLIG